MEGGLPSSATRTLVTQPPCGYRELCALREGQGDLSDNAELIVDNSASSAVGTTAFHRVRSVLPRSRIYGTESTHEITLPLTLREEKLVLIGALLPAMQDFSVRSGCFFSSTTAQVPVVSQNAA